MARCLRLQAPSFHLYPSIELVTEAVEVEPLLETHMGPL